MIINESDYNKVIKYLADLKFKSNNCEGPIKHTIDIQNDTYYLLSQTNQIRKGNKCTFITKDLENILDFIYSNNEMNNIEKYTYRNYFRIDTKINNYWKELKIIENVIFNDNIYEEK